VLPFTREQFIANFAAYNEAVWPLQVLAYLLAGAMVVMLLRPSRRNSRLIGLGLAAMWALTGIAYHALFFSTINKAAWVFGALFVLQGALLFHAAVLRGGLDFGVAAGRTQWLAWALMAYASVVYPLVGLWAGHPYPEMPMFGITPCPVTIFTFGMLLMTTRPVSRWLLVIPFAWSLVGGSAAALLQIPQDWLLLASGFITVAALACRGNPERAVHAAPGAQIRVQ
jgi:hypothetical protein